MHAEATILRNAPLFDNQAFIESIAACLLKLDRMPLVLC
jgi:hypothetical protein